jgi:hypothetical protein
MGNGIQRIERRVKLHDLRVLMSVVERGSMAKAAESLATSQPAISRSIAYPGHRQLMPKLRAFIDHVKSHSGGTN